MISDEEIDWAANAFAAAVEQTAMILEMSGAENWDEESSPNDEAPEA